MININITKDEIIIKGHAGFSEYGTDIVCAAVSSIAITTVNAILKLSPETIKYKEKNGFLKIQILKENEITLKLINNMISLLEELEKQYQKNIKITN